MSQTLPVGTNDGNESKSRIRSTGIQRSRLWESAPSFDRSPTKWPILDTRTRGRSNRSPRTPRICTFHGHAAGDFLANDDDLCIPTRLVWWKWGEASRVWRERFAHNRIHSPVPDTASSSSWKGIHSLENNMDTPYGGRYVDSQPV